MQNKINTNPLLPRRLVIIAGSFLLLYPFIRFISHRVPRKPVTVKVSEPLKQDHFLALEDFFIFAEDERAWAVSRKCTHLGCRLHYKEKEDVLECPCHQSRFTTAGIVINGPSQKQLKRYQVERIADPPAFLVST